MGNIRPERVKRGGAIVGGRRCTLPAIENLATTFSHFGESFFD
jgi:hypothetical protein